MIDLCCPRCKGVLVFESDTYKCTPCLKSYPIILGIPDFRVHPDPYIDIEDDINKGKLIAEKYEMADFQQLVRYYWEITPDVPKELTERYMRYAKLGIARGHNSLRSIESNISVQTKRNKGTFLDLGCGTAGLLVAVGQSYGKEGVGIDIAFRWLVIAKKRLEESGVTADLVCCCAEFLPFKDEQFDLIVANNVIEHTKLQKDMLMESYRVLETGGKFFAITVNRFSLTPEPHIRLWGVGFLPRRWMSKYAQWRKQVPYNNIKNLSYFEVKRFLKNANFKCCKIFLPIVSEDEFELFSFWEKCQVFIYRILKRLPIVRTPLLFFSPLFNIIAHK